MKSIFISIFLFLSAVAFAQEVALKTNIAYWATATPNLGIEIGISPKMSLNLTGNYNPFKFKADKKIAHWLIQPEWRFWTCERFQGHFFGIHGHYARYNGGIKKYRYDGWMTGGGISYGYQWIIGRRWNLETEIGVGYVYLDYDKYVRSKCGKFISSRQRHYVGPTKLSISFMYFLK